MDIDLLIKAGLSKIQANIYLYLVEKGQSTPAEIAKGINENRTTVYSAAEKLAKLDIIKQKDRGKITAYIPSHPSVLASIAEKRLHLAANRVKNLESTLPSLINYYNERQHEPGVSTFYGQEGINLIRDKIISTGKTFYFVRSHHDEKDDPKSLEKFKNDRVAAHIQAEDITPSEFSTTTPEQAQKWLLNRTLLPPSEYESPVEIDIFGDNVAFVNYAQDGMSTLIESPEIADAMRQFFKFSKKYIEKATDQAEYIKQHQIHHTPKASSSETQKTTPKE